MRKKEVLRLKNVLLKDKSQVPDKFDAVIESDTMALLNEYAEVEKIKCKIDLDENGEYTIKIIAHAKRLRSMPTLI